MRCTRCGEEAEVRDVEFGMNIGLIVARLQQVKQGRMCSGCISKTFWLYSLTTLFLGWWGIISFFATPIILVSNVITYCCPFLSPPYPSDPAPMILDSALVTALEPRRAEIFNRIFKGETMQEVAEDIGPQIGATPAEVMAFYYESFIVANKDHSGSGQPDLKQAEPGAAQAIQQTPTDAEDYTNRAHAWLSQGNYDKALMDYDQAIRLQPENAVFLNSRGFTWHIKSIAEKDRSTCEDRALADYAEAIRINPKNASAINNRAWLWATSKVDRCRNGQQAVEEARKACELTGWKNAGYLDTLSVAYAEVGDFEQAIRWQRQALEDPSYKKEDGETARHKLALFDKKQPFRE